MGRSWLDTFFAGRTVPPSPQGGFETQRFLDVPNLRFGEVELTELSREFQDQLTQACTVDANILRVWIFWIYSGKAQPELLAVLKLDRPDDEAIHNFLRRVYSPGEPGCVACLVDENAKGNPFYQRA